MVLRVVGSSPISHPKKPRQCRGFVVMFYCYVLKSLKDEKYYFGHTADLNLRLDVHNKGKVKSAKSRVPFIIHYYETFETKGEAAKRETYFKSINGYLFLKEHKII